MNEYQKHGLIFIEVSKFIESHRQVEMRIMRSMFMSVPFDEFQNIIKTLKQVQAIKVVNGILVWMNGVDKQSKVA